MIHKITLNDDIKNNLLEYIKKIVFVTGDQEVMYSKGQPIVPKNTSNNWLFDFRRMFLDSRGITFLVDILRNRYAQDTFSQFATIELSSVLLSGALLFEQPNIRPIFTSSLIVRKSRKKDGLGNIIEGKYTGGDVLMIDDIVNSGDSLFRSIKILEDSGIKIKRIFCILCFLNENFLKQLHFKYPDITLDYIFDLSDFGLTLSGSEKKFPFQIFPESQLILDSESFHKTLVVPKSSPLISGETIFMASESGIVKAFSIITKSLLWEFKIDTSKGGKNIISSLVDNGESIIFGAYDGSIYILDKKTGQAQNIVSLSDWIGSTPCRDSQTGDIFVGLESYGMLKGGIVKLSSKMKEIWHIETKEFIHCSPYYIEDLDIVVCGTNDGELYGIKGDTGDILWNIQIGGAIKAGFCYIQETGSVCFGSFDRAIYSVEVISGKILWTIETKQIVYSTPLSFKGDIFIGCVDRKFYHLDSQGNIIYEYETGGRIFSTPIPYRDDFIVFGSNDMKIYFYSLKQKRMVFFIQHSERITTKPIIRNNTLYIEDFANRLFIYNLDSLNNS